MKKVSDKIFDNIKKKFDFYDFDELLSKKKESLIVTFKDKNNLVTYSDLHFGGNKTEYEDEERILISFLKTLFRTMDEPCCIIRKYSDEWVCDKKRTQQLVEKLDIYSVFEKYDGVLAVKTDDLLIELFLESVFKYNSFVQFIFIENEVIVSPSDHMDVFIDYREHKFLESQILKSINICGEDKLILLDKKSL